MIYGGDVAEFLCKVLDLDDWRHLLHRIDAEPDKMAQHLDKTNGNVGDNSGNPLLSLYRVARDSVFICHVDSEVECAG